MPPIAASRSRPLGASPGRPRRGRRSSRPRRRRPRRVGAACSGRRAPSLGAAPRAPSALTAVPALRPHRAARRRPGRCRHVQRDEVARRHRRGAAHDDDAAEQVFDLAAASRVDRGLAGDHAAQEPARAVDADEAGEPRAARLALGRGDRDLGEQLGAERAVAHGGRAALLARSGRRSARGSRARGRSSGAPRTAAPAASSSRSRGRRRRRACVPSSTSRRRCRSSRGRILTPPRSTYGRTGFASDSSNGPAVARSSGADLGCSTGLVAGRSRCRSRDSLLTLCSARYPVEPNPPSPRMAAGQPLDRRRTGPG